MTLLIIILLLGFSASFSGFETALFSLSPLQRFHLKEAGGVAGLVHKIIQKPREILTTILFGNELVNVAISIMAGSIAYGVLVHMPVRSAFFVSTAVTTLTILIFGEILPKNFAIRSPLMVSQVLVVPYLAFSWLVTPFRWVFTKIANGIVRLFGGDPKTGRRLIVEEELRSLLEHGKKEGTLADLERLLIQNALNFSDVTLFKVMTQREKVVAIALDTPFPEILKILEKHRFSRIPVYRANLNEIEGVLYSKDLLPFRLDSKSVELFSLRNILKPHIDVTPDETLEEVFGKFQRYRTHIAVVKDRTNKVIGLITMDDLLRKFFPQPV